MKHIYKLLSSLLISIIVLCISFLGYTLYEYIKYKKHAFENSTQVALVRNLELTNEDFVDISNYITDIKIELRYATTNNVTGKILYSSNKAYIRKGTADKLKKANDEFRTKGYFIKIWDAYRPLKVQYELWNKVRDARYIANPLSSSVHNRGAAVDITLVDSKGKEIKMPTDFDGFSLKCDRNYSDITTEEENNVIYLQSVMQKYGFSSIYTEWWHFNDFDYKNYDIVEELKDKNFDSTNFELDVKGTEIDYSAINGKETFSRYFVNKISNISLKNIKTTCINNIIKLKCMLNKFNTKV